MQRWGLTIDLVSCIGLELAVGLCVDYAAHVGHTFLTIRKGTRDERALETILQIGAAVLYGGGSTLFAVAMLAHSEAYTFQAFFKIFLLVVVFGLFHGVVFLPVVLSLVGPSPYVRKDEDDNKRPNGTKMTPQASLMEEYEAVSFINGTSVEKKGANGEVTARQPQRRHDDVINKWGNERTNGVEMTHVDLDEIRPMNNDD